MAEPVRLRLRPARRSGLTSPDRSAPATAPRPPTPAPEPEPRTSRRPGERQDAHTRIHPGKLLMQESESERPNGIGRWIEA